MIEQDGYDGDIYEVSCDYCSNDIEINSGGEWLGMINKIKDLGWKIARMKDDEWKHMCPECAKKKVAFK